MGKWWFDKILWDIPSGNLTIWDFLWATSRLNDDECILDPFFGRSIVCSILVELT